jgi:glycosyltransferase involved in cell wall biosynthesis
VVWECSVTSSKLEFAKIGADRNDSGVLSDPKPLATCIIPAYQAERYLPALLGSALAQTWPHLEIIVVDDGSSDGTADLARKYDPSIKVIQQPNGGPAVARNTGLTAASGKFIGFADADDLMEPEKFEAQIEFLLASPQLGYSICLMQNFVSEELTESVRIRDPRLLEVMRSYSFGGLIATRETFDRVGSVNPDLGHADDTDWIGRADEAGVAHGVVERVLYRRRLHDSNRSQQLGGDSREEYLRLIKAKLDRRRAAKKPGPDGAKQ